VPRIDGRSGSSARARCAAIAAGSISARSTSSASGATFATSCEVRNPSKKCRNGSRAVSVVAWAIAARSWASCTEPEHSIAMPVARAAITSE
jgi:hypothetical protein